MSDTEILCIVPPFTYGNYDYLGPKCPNLGIATIAAYLEENGIKVKILDAFALDLTFDKIKEEIKRLRPKHVFIGSVTSTHQTTLKISEIAKEINPNMKVVIGGPHVTNLPESAFPQADYAVLNEGEETALELSQKLLGKKKINIGRIKGIAYLKNGKVKLTEKRHLVIDLNKLPMPAYHLLPMDAYKAYGWFDVGRRFTTMITSRGCPFSCTFCASSENFKHFWRARSAENVFKEMKLLYEKYRIRHIYFQDDDFCVDNERVRQICRMIKEYKMDIYWECLARVVSVNEDILKTMADTGCKGITYGIEVGYEDGWKRINKPITKEQVFEAVRLTQKYHIMTRASFITGFPWESEKEIRKTINFAKELDPDVVFFTTLNPFPGTKLWADYFENDPSLLAEDVTSNSYIIHGAAPVIRTKYLSSEQIEFLNGKAYMEFYLRPRYLIRKLKSIHNFHEFNRSVRSGILLMKLALNRIMKNA